MPRSQILAAIPHDKINEYTWGFMYDEDSKKFNLSSFNDQEGEGIITQKEIEEFCAKVLDKKKEVDEKYPKTFVSMCCCCGMNMQQKRQAR